jgi:hypothetical protein
MLLSRAHVLFPIAFVQYVGKQYGPVFRQPIAANAADNRCLSLVAGLKQVSIEFETVQTLTVYVAGISHVLNSGGMTVQLEETEKTEASSPSSVAGSRRRYSVQQFQKELPASPQAVVQQLAARRPTLMALSAASTLLMMQEGRIFTRWFERPDHTFASEKCAVFYQPASGSEKAAFFWCSPDQHLAQPNCRVILNDVTDVYRQFRAAAMKAT